MKPAQTGDDSLWQRTQYANPVRCKPSRAYFARIRIGGKLIRRSPETSVLPVTKSRLGDLENKERRLAEHQAAAVNGRTTFNEALDIYKQRLEGDASLKSPELQPHELDFIGLEREG